MILRHEILDATFLDAIRAKVDDDMIRDAVARAVALRRARQSATLERTPAIEREIQGVDQRITRLVDAVAIGGPVEELVERLKAQRARKATLVDEQRSLYAHDGDYGTGDLTSRLFARAAELRRLLGIHVGARDSS